MTEINRGEGNGATYNKGGPQLGIVPGNVANMKSSIYKTNQ